MTDYLDQRDRAVNGITPYHLMLEQAQQKALPAQAVVNGTPIITSGHRLAAAVDRAAKHQPQIVEQCQPSTVLEPVSLNSFFRSQPEPEQFEEDVLNPPAIAAWRKDE